MNNIESSIDLYECKVSFKSKKREEYFEIKIILAAPSIIKAGEGLLSICKNYSPNLEYKNIVSITRVDTVWICK